MIQVVYTPIWFYGKDLIIDVISAFVLLLIASFSIRYYKIEKKNKNYINLAISFFLIALSFSFKTLTNFTIYYKVLETKNFGLFSLTYQLIKTSDILFFTGFLLYRLLTLLGLYMLYSIYQKKQPKSNIFLIIFFILTSTYFSQSAYYIFHLTSLVILSFVTFQYYKNFKKNRQSTAKLLTSSFAIIGISQIFFVFVNINNMIYVLAELTQLLGYLILLITFIKVLRNAKKKE